MSKISKEEEKQLRISPNMHPVPTNQKLKSAKIPLIGYVAVVAILIVGLVGTAKSLGWYGTSGKVSASGEAVTLSSSSVGADLKGWMTLDSFLKAFGITKKQFEVEFKAPAGLDGGTTLGELGSVTNEKVSMEVLRPWVDAGHKLGATVAPVAATTAAASSNPAVATTHSTQSSPTGTETPSNADSTGAFVIKGRTTIQEVLTETKISKADFYAKFKIPETVPVSAALSTIKESLPNFEITVLQDWYATLK
jgi:hypothetical protein